MKKVFTLALALFISGNCFSQVSEQWLNISYAADTLTGHKLDIYLPETGEGPYPVIVSIAGSAWFENNTKERAFRLARPLLEQGFAVVAVNHRSSHNAIFPAQLHDIKAVVRFLRAHASEYELDTTFLGIMGDSSGGHLSALMGTTKGMNNHTVGNVTLYLEGDLGKNTDQSSRVDAVVDWYGPTTFQQMDACGSSFSHDASDSPESTLVGGPIQEMEDMAALADPITYIDPEDPPFLILHGDTDPLVPHCQSELLHEALMDNGVQNELIIVPDGEHGGSIMWQDKHIQRMAVFFSEELNKKKSVRD